MDITDQGQQTMAQSIYIYLGLNKRKTRRNPTANPHVRAYNGVKNINDVIQVKTLLSSFAEARPHEICSRVMSLVDSENLARS